MAILRALLHVSLPLVYQAAMVTVDYSEGGKRFRQLMFVVIEDMIKLKVGMWMSKSTIAFRAPAAEFKAALPIGLKVQQSVQINMDWLAAEMNGAAARTNTVAGTFQRSEVLDAQMVKNRMDTNAAINHQIQKILTKVEG